MRREGVPDAAIATFADQYRQLEAGATGMMPEADLEPVSDLVVADELPTADAPLDETVIVKLNGGLGTSMGMTQAKSLIEAKDGQSFLDVVVRQVLELRRRHGARLPLVLMDSFSTREDSLRALERFDDLAVDVPLDFVQNKEPKIRADDLEPVAWPAEPGPGVVPARPRRHLHRPADLGDARHAARAGLPVRVPLELRQPRRGARAAHPRVARRRAGALRDGGRRPHRGRPQGRPRRAPAGRRPAGAARDVAGAGRGPGGVSGHGSLGLHEHEQPVGRPAGARRPARGERRRARAPDHRQPQDRRSRRHLVARRGPARDRDGRRRSGSSRARGRCTSRAGGSRPSRPPTTS